MFQITLNVTRFSLEEKKKKRSLLAGCHVHVAEIEQDLIYGLTTAELV